MQHETASIADPQLMAIGKVWGNKKIDSLRHHAARPRKWFHTTCPDPGILLPRDSCLMLNFLGQTIKNGGGGDLAPGMPTELCQLGSG